MGNSSMLKWAAVFGVSIGLLTGIPFGGLLVCCSLCMIIVLPGFLAAWRVSVDAASRGEAFDVGPGTLTGLLAGLFYGVTNGIITPIVTYLFPASSLWMLESFQEFAESAEGVPAESLDQIDALIDQATNPEFGFLVLIFSIIKSTIFGVLFSTIGGLIAGAVFSKKKKQDPAPQAPDVVEPPTE